MGKINKTFDFIQSEENLYNIDNYNTQSGTKSLELDFAGNIKLKNFNTQINTDNFYGDGRLGYFKKRDSISVRPLSVYFKEIIEHPTYGACLWDVWFGDSQGSFQKGDEVILHKKHIEKESYLDELGQWEIVTITGKIIEGDPSLGTEKIHYQISSMPVIEFSTRTANSCTMILQYETLELFDNTQFYLDLPTNWYITQANSKIWNNRVLSYPDGILFIKASDEIIIGRNSKIASRYGYNGAHVYSTRYYARGGAPLGCGMDADGIYDKPDITDVRTNHCYSMGYPFHGPGGMGYAGVNHSSNTHIGRAGPRSDDLNENIYYGIGCQGAVQSGHEYGPAGGGIVIIQTPKITFMNKRSRIDAWGTYNGVDSRGVGGSGSILVKTEEIIINENPGQLALFDEDIPSLEDIRSGVVNNFGLSIFSVMYMYNTQKQANMDGNYGPMISAPGQMQLEIDKMNLEGTIIAQADITENNLKDIIQDYRICNIASNIRTDLTNLIEPWDFNTNQKTHSHNHWAPKYETGSWFRFYTNGIKNIDIEGWYDVVRIVPKYKPATGTEIKIAFSIDAGLSWKYFDVTDPDDPVISSIDIDVSSSFDTGGNTPEELENMINQTFMTSSLILPQRSKENKTIDVCIAIKTTKEHISPLFDYIWFNYDMVPILSAPIPINPYNGEEFNNEYVDFVWLQPSQKFGSLQNRIEINTIPNFDKDEMALTADEDAISSSDDKIMIPYKPSQYDNKVNTCNYFKLPYLKHRAAGIVNAYDHKRHSFMWDKETRTISYDGGDEYFHKGNIIKLPAHEDIIAPTELDFTLKNITVPQSGSLAFHIDFTGATDYNITPAVGSGVWNLEHKGTAIVQEPNVAHNVLPRFFANDESYIEYRCDKDYLKADNWLRQNNQKTIMIRFNPGDLELNDDCYLFSVNNWSWNSYWGDVGLHKGRNQFNEDEIYFFWTNGYHTRYANAECIHQDSENVIVIRYNGDNYAEGFINGIPMTAEQQAHYYDTEHTSYYQYDDPDGTWENQMVMSFGQRARAYSSDKAFRGKLIEFAIWETALSDEEIETVSQVPNYNLRYNISTNTLEWKRVPYYDHLSDYQFVQDKVDDFRYNERWEINRQWFSAARNNCYKNNHDSLLIGTYSPNKSEENSWFEHTQEWQPIDGIPFMTCRYGNDTKAYREKIVYLDNNSVRNETTGDAQYIGLIAQERINASEDSVELNFFYRDVEMSSYKNYHDIELQTGVFTPSNNTYRNMYSRYFSIRKHKENGFTCGVWVRHTNGRVYPQLNPGVYDETTMLPYDLIPDTMYTMRIMVNDSVSSSSFWLFSDFDGNYKNGVKLWDQQMYNGHTPSSYGYMSTDFKDTYYALNYPYEDYMCTMNQSVNPSFELINIAKFDENSTVSEKAGFIPRYDTLLHITNDFLKKINYIDVLGDSDNALTDMRFFCSFDGGNQWRVYDKDNTAWALTTIDNYENGMTAEEIMALSTYEYEQTNGFELGKEFSVRAVLVTKDSRSTPYIDWVKVSYNGPLTIDSWKDDGSFYNGTTFYYCDDSSWNPYLEPDFTGTSQTWKEMGDGVPDTLSFSEGHGSKPSTNEQKVFGGVRLLLNPKGKYYWRIAAYNGQK